MNHKQLYTIFSGNVERNIVECIYLTHFDMIDELVK